MKSSYITRAIKFMEDFIFYLDKYKNPSVAVLHYNIDYHRNVSFHHGITRNCVCCSDYAIKWDYDAYAVEIYGGCEQEYTNYKFAKSYGFEYLFAEITPVSINGKIFYIMPRVTNLAVQTGKYYYPNSLLSEDELTFINHKMGLRDLHDENWGFYHGRVLIIDYANNLKI